MQFSYRGFQHENGIRQYTFYGMVNKQPDRIFHLTADLTLLAKHSVSLQEAPSICVHLLNDAFEKGEANLESYHQYALSAPDLLAFTAPRREAAAIRASKQPVRLHRKPQAASSVAV
ncbi:MAG: hypothetical protein M3Y07_16280 [Acidobacteriota bacterium]|nr:hypothetical protein [Acidobacteriota bacterium]